MENRRLTDKDKVLIKRTYRHQNFIDFVTNKTAWEFEVFNAFYPRLRIDGLSAKSKAKKALDVFYENPDDEVARLLVSDDLHKWRPTGIGIFAELVLMHQDRTDKAIIEAIEKSSTIGSKAFKEEYPAFATTKSIPPKLILETVLFQDHGITLSTKGADSRSVYDGLREDDES